MNLAFFISKRYLIARKSHHAINIITSISVGLVAIGTMALIIIMSVFNGLENLVGNLNSSINSDLLIEAKQSKYIDLQDIKYNKIRNLSEIAYFVPILEDNVLFKYTPALEENPREFIGKIRGVDASFEQATLVNEMMIDGEFKLSVYNRAYGVLGNGVAARLQIQLNDLANPVECYYPKANAKVNLNPMDAVSVASFLPSGVFSIQQETDDQLVIASLDFVQRLMQRPNQASAIQINLRNSLESDRVQTKIQKILGSKFSVKNRQEQNVVMYNIMKSEKWSSFLILSFILFIATFNLVGALSVLIIDKQRDIYNLSFMGANKWLISKIFFLEGFMVSLSGTLIGLILGSTLVLLQSQFHLIPMQGSFVVEAFPVELRLSDIAIILSVVLSVSMLAVLYPIQRLSHTLLKKS